VRAIIDRIYAAYLMPSRLAEYERLVTTALEHGYTHVTIPEFYRMAVGNGLTDAGKLFIHRHDVDLDVRTAERMFEIEERHSIKSSFYFRLSTWDIGLIKRIATHGSEVGYHFEEIAQYCKDHNASGEEAKKRYEIIRKIFTANFTRLERISEHKIRTIASHGDFVNRIIDIKNNDFITSELLTQLGIEFECYDRVLSDNYQTILSDTEYPRYYKPESPFECIERGDRIIYILTHPIHWHVARRVSIRSHIRRVIEGIRYSAG